MLIRKPSRRELIKYGIGAAAFCAMEREARASGISFVASRMLGSTGTGTASSWTTTALGSSALNSATSLIVGVCACGYFNAGSFVPMTLTDSNGNSYLQAGTGQQQSGSGSSDYGILQLFVCTAATISSGMTFSVSSYNSSNQIGVYGIIMEIAGFTGIATSSPVDTSNQHINTGSGSTIQPGSMTPTVNNELVFFAAGGISTSGAPSISSGVSQLDANNYTDVSAVFGYTIQTTALAINPTATVPPYPGLYATIAQQVAFKPATASTKRRIIVVN